MLSIEQEQKLKMLLDAIPEPQSRSFAEQLRDDRGRFTEKKEFKSELDKVTWKPVGNGVYVRRRKSFYILCDVLVLMGVLIGVMLFV